MKGDDTYITQAGVMRCCLASVGKEFEGKDVEIGAKCQCEYCHEKFTLVSDPNVRKPIWIPDWQIEKRKEGA